MLKKQKGITLIALIITIIVMLILVGVTINVALNGGLFDKAEDAAIGTEKQAIYEQIVSNMELTNEGKISVKGTFDKVIAEFGTDKVTNINPATVEENTTEVTFSIVGKTGTYNYKISGKSIEKDPVESSVPGTPPQEPPSELAGNVYEGVMGTIYIAKNYNYIWLPPGMHALMPYEYADGNLECSNPVNSVTYNFTVSQDKEIISINMGGTEYTFTLVTDKEYSPKYLGEKDVYVGIYYNVENKKFATICDFNEYNATPYWFQNENNYIATGDQSLGGIQFKSEDRKTIQFANPISGGVYPYDGECLEYTLLEAGEF